MKLVRVMPLIPWWLLAKALRFDRFDRNYDWSLSGITRTPFRRSAILLGWAFWAIVAGGLLAAGVQTEKRGSRMNRKCKQCGGVIGSVPETTCTCHLLRVDMRHGKQFVATQRELSAIIEILRNELKSDMQENPG